MEILQKYKKEIDAYLAAYLSSKEKDFARVNAWGPDALNKIQSVVSEGKTIRGSLVLLIHDVLKGKNKNSALRVAAAYELIQTGLVIHDDIMDHDSMRRGKPTMQVQYKSEAMAMCVGDILFFLAHELLDESPVQKISAQIFQEVGIAQMQDVSFSLTDNIPSKEEIIALYKYKTARYTFALPMMAGALLAGADKTTVKQLEQLGENMGILFQIQNDTLNVKGDIREGKKTLARLYAPVEPDLKTYYKNALKSLGILNRIIDTTALENLLTYITTHE